MSGASRVFWRRRCLEHAFMCEMMLLLFWWRPRRTTGLEQAGVHGASARDRRALFGDWQNGPQTAMWVLWSGKAAPVSA